MYVCMWRALHKGEIIKIHHSFIKTSMTKGMKKFLLFLLWVFSSLQGTEQLSLPSDPTYNAAVVEFIPAANGSARYLVMDNLKRIKSIIESEVTNDLDILVFPEFVLNNMDMLTYVPDPKANVTPCDKPDYDFFLTELSCAIRSRKLYGVFNVLEKFACNATEPCDEDGLKKFNTNVVFDREGRVISRYRKTHLYRYEWYRTNVLAQPELATFTTDFGVTFGHFICFDMLFYEPAQVLIKQLNITDIIYPTYWFSELPFLTAVQLQEGWAFANNVNLLAADASIPSKQNTGSGIYAGRLGRLTAVINEVPTTQVLKARVPKRQYMKNYQTPPSAKPVFVPSLESKRFTKMDLLRDYNVDIFSTILLDESFTSVDQVLCHDSFCCSFHIRRTRLAESSRHVSYRYRLAAYSGSRTTFQRIDSSNQSVCAIIACTSSELYTCGHIFPESVLVGNKYYFSSINITGNFAKADKRLIMPSTVNSIMLPLHVNSFDWLENERSAATKIEMNLTVAQQDLLTFGIWANYYSTAKSTHNLDDVTKRPQHAGRNSAARWSRESNNLIILTFFLPLTLTLKKIF